MPITDEELKQTRSFCGVCGLELVLEVDAEAQPYRGQEVTVLAAAESAPLPHVDWSDGSLGRMTACPACAGLVWLPVAALERKRGRCVTCERDFVLVRTTLSALRSGNPEELAMGWDPDDLAVDWQPPRTNERKTMRRLGAMVVALAWLSPLALASEGLGIVGFWAWVLSVLGSATLFVEAIIARDRVLALQVMAAFVAQALAVHAVLGSLKFGT